MEIEKVFTIKWSGKTLELKTSKQTITELKQDIQNLTNVLASRQKLVVKGKILNDKDSMDVLPERSVITLIGSAEKDLITASNTTNVVFMEDLTKEDKLRIMKEKGEEIVYGLKNLGNTCYFNSLIQILGGVEPLRQALYKSKIQGGRLDSVFCQEAGKVYNELANATDTVVPHMLVQVLRKLNPAFDKNEKGYYQQQDADECLFLILNTYKQFLKNDSTGEKYSENLIDELFNIELNIEMTNVEDNTEIKKQKDNSFKLVCYIENNTNELVGGLKNSLVEDIDLFSEKLSRNTVFVKRQFITRLPPYLNVQFMRFFWKKANEDIHGSKDEKVKKLKSVMFSKIIDIYDLCTPEVQEVLKLGRNIETKMLKEDPSYRADLSCMKQGENMVPTGRYQLIGVVTHQGRSSESGHYIGWVYKKDDKWIKYDDDVISYVKIEDILELKGGGDWHMAYICLYKSLEVPFQEI